MSNENESARPELHQQTMIQYLLGELPPAWQAQLEEQFFTDPKSFAQLKQVEDQLVDDYVNDALSPEQRQRFESHYLISNRNYEKLQFARTLKQSLRHFVPHAAPEPRANLWQSIVQAWQTPALRYSFASLAIIALLSAGWWYWQTQQLQQQRTQLAVARDKLAAPSATPVPVPTAAAAPTAQTPTIITPPPPPNRRASQPNTILTVLLTPSRLRTDDNTARNGTILVPPQTQMLRLKLPLQGQERYSTYRITLETATGQSLPTQSTLRPVQIGRERFLLVDLATKALPANDYLLTLLGKSAGEYEEVEDYQFRIVKRP